jgi:hypothetical protein
VPAFLSAPPITSDQSGTGSTYSSIPFDCTDQVHLNPCRAVLSACVVQRPLKINRTLVRPKQLRNQSSSKSPPKMSLPTNATHNFLILLPTIHASFNASPAAASAITDAVSVSPPAEQKTRRSSSTTSAASGISDSSVTGPAADAEPTVVTPFAKDGFLILGS